MSQDVSPATNTVPPIIQDVLRSPDQPLDAGTRAFMEPRFGQDFSQVRVHTDAKAAESTRAVNALAYTVGQHIRCEYCRNGFDVSSQQSKSKSRQTSAGTRA